MADIYVATRSAVLYHGDKRVRLVKGVTTVRAGHPLLEGRDDSFEPLTVEYDTDADSAGGESEEVVEDDDAEDDTDEDDAELPPRVTHLGSGWYDVDGEKVRGRDAAVERARAADDEDEGDGGE